MVTRTKPEILPPEQDETASPHFPTPPQLVEDEPDRALENVLADLGGENDAKVNVYLLEPGKGSAFVGSFEPSNFSIEEIQRTYGPGEYKIHVRRDGRLVANRTIRVAAPKNPIVSAGVSGVDKNEIAKLVEGMNNGFSTLANMIAQTVQAVAANQPKAKTTQEILQEMMLMKEIVTPAATGGGENSIELFLKGIEFAKGITPRESEPGANEIILEAIKNFGGMFAQMKPVPRPAAPSGMIAPAVPAAGAAPVAPTVPAAPAAPAAPAVPGANAAPVAPTPQPLTDENMNLVKTIYLNTLLSNAKADNDPMTYANMALDLLGENQVLALVNRPDWFELLCSEIPEAANYREWFDEMRSNIFVLTGGDSGAMNTGETKPEPAPDAIQPQTSEKTE